MDSRLKAVKCREYLHYHLNYDYFDKIVMQSQFTAVVSQTDGVVKVFDLRAQSLRALNRFVLHKDIKQKQHYRHNRLKLVGQTNNIFCTYNDSSYLINSQTKDIYNTIYEQNIKLADRYRINEFNIGSKTGDRNKCYYDINTNGDTIVNWQDGVLYKCDVAGGRIKRVGGSGEVGYVGFDLWKDEVWCCQLDNKGFFFKLIPMK